jgi:hypothetical protein
VQEAATLAAKILYFSEYTLGVQMYYPNIFISVYSSGAAL